jgi:competence protein ComEC
MARRPFLAVALCFAAGVLVADWISFWLPGAFLLSLALALTVFVWEGRRGLLLGLLLFCAGITRQTLDLQPLSPFDLRLIQSGKPEDLTIFGRLRETPRERLTLIRGREAWRSRAVIEVEALKRGDRWERAEGLVAAQAGGLLPSDFFAGRGVEVAGVLKTPPGALAEGMFDYREYLRRQNIAFELDARETNAWSVRWETAQPARAPFGDRFIAWARATLARGLPAEDTPLRLNWAMTLDWKGGLTPEVVEPFLRAGTYHVFAVDGLRIGLISAIFLGLFRTARIPKTIAGLLVIPLLWFYAATTGWAASAIRAALMMSVILAGWSARRPGDLLNSMCAAAFLILAWQPQQLFQAGFQLSFMVVASMAVLSPVLARLQFRRADPLAPAPPAAAPNWRNKLGRHARAGFLGALGAWLGSVPLTAYYFNLFSAASIPGNLLVMPVCVLCLICDLGSLLAGAFFPGLSGLFNNAAWFFMKIISILSEWAASLPSGAWYVAAPSLAAMALYYVLLLAVLTGWIFRTPRKRWAWALLILLTAVWSRQKWDESRTVALHLLSDRGAEVLFCSRALGGGAMLVNAGRSNTVDRLIKPFLRAHGVNRLPLLVLTHGDAPHAGGLASLDALFRPVLELTGPARTRSAVFGLLRAESRTGRVTWREVAAGVDAGGWEVLYPPAAPRPARAEDDAVVLRGEFYGTRVLLISNLGWAGQRGFLERNKNPRADVLIGALTPGGETLGDSLLNAVKPDLIIVDDGEPGSAMHAPDELRSRLGSRRGRALWFHETGSIKLEFKPGGWTAVSAQNHELAVGVPEK